MKKTLSLILALSMLLVCFAGCGTPAESAEAPQEEATSVVSAEAPAEEVVEETEAEAPVSAVEEAAEVSAITYPICDPDDPLELSLFSVFGMGFDAYLDSWNSLPRLDDIQAATGVRMTFHEVSMTGASEQFNLMVVSGDLTDIIQPTDYYIGGLSAALDEEVIIDLTDIIEENAPIYYDLLMNHTNQTTIETVLVNGRHLSMNTIKDEAVSDMGLIARGDWLEELGLELPETLEEFTDMLYAMKNKYNPKQTLYVNSDAEIANTPAIFGTNLFKVGNNTSVSAYVDDGVIKSGLVDDRFREYLEWFHQLYEDGIIYSDFYTNASTESEAWGLITSNNTGVWRLGADTIAKVAGYEEIAGAYGQALPKMVKEEGDKYLMASAVALSDNKGFSLTSCCEEPELALQFFDWFFTEEGILLANYGIEGETFEYDENGKPQFSDYITDNPDPDLTMMFAVILNTFNQTPMYNIVSKMWVGYTAEEEAAIHMWSDTSNDDTSNTIPAAAAMTSEETNQISSEMTAVISVAEEAILKFMTGAVEINDANWEAYVQDVEAAGLQACLDVQQEAYDAYLRGERTVVATVPGPPPDGGGGAPEGPPPEGPPPA